MTQKQLIAKEVEQDLKDIIQRKFNNLLKLESHVGKNRICDWDLRFDSTHGFPVCLKTTEKLEFMHPNDQWSYWAQSVVEDELTIKYDGRMSDEAYPQKNIKPAPELHATFRNYLESNTIYHSKTWKQAIITVQISQLPPELKLL